MSDNIETTSLAGLASHKGAVSREGPDLKAKNVSAQATNKTGFDGFLKTFLGKDTQSRSGKSTKSNSRFGYNESVTSSKGRGKSSKSGTASSGGMKMDPSQKKALRESMDKTVPADDGGEETSAETRAAADEAAQIIWNLLYGPMNGMDDYLLGAGGIDPLKQLAGLINDMGWGKGSGSLAGMGMSGLDPAALEQAMETANASAEMNAAAVLSALDELLDGMPREALADALNRTAEAMGMGGAEDMFNQIAAALDAEIVSVNVGGEADLLAFLSGAALYDSANASGWNTAENAGIGTTDTKIFAWFEEFLAGNASENSSGRSINLSDPLSPEEAEELLNSFANWLAETGKASNGKELSGNLDRLAQALVRGAGNVDATATGAQGANGTVFSWTKSNLENLLQSASTKNAEVGSGENVRPMTQNMTGDAGGNAAMLFPGQNGATAGGNAGQAAQNCATASSMLDQMQNIERLTEAMKMANRGGVKNLTLQLSPPELGKVMLRVEARDGVVSAFLRVEKPEAASQLAGNLNQLRENLKAQGIELGELDIQQRGQHEALGDFSGQRHRKDADNDYQSRYGSGNRDENDAEDGPETAAADGEISAKEGGPLNLFA